MERRQFLTTCAVAGGVVGLLAVDAARADDLLPDDDPVLTRSFPSAVASQANIRIARRGIA
jgi:hypothetical protein